MIWIKTLVFITFLSYDHMDILDMKCLENYMTSTSATREYIFSLMGY